MRERWTEQDEKRLLFNLGAMPLPRLAKTLNRSPRAIQERCKRHGTCVTRAIFRNNDMSTQACAHLLGTNRQRVERWIKLGWLCAQHNKLRERSMITLTNEALETFLRTRGGLLEGLQPDAEWEDVFEDARRDLHECYINRDEIADRLCFDRRRLSDPEWTQLHNFPAIALRLEQRRCWYKRTAVREWLRTAHQRYRTARTLRAFGLEET